MGDPRLNLKKAVRPFLISLENTIIFSLLERSQYKVNNRIYIPEEIPIKDFSGSFLDFLLHGIEELYAAAGCYNDPKQHAFSQNLPSTKAERQFESSPIKEKVDLNPWIRETYFKMMRTICEPGDDGQHGSSAVHDVKCLQALSKRIHLGLYVAESKFQQDPEGYMKLIQAGDIKGIDEKLTVKSVEEKIFKRVGQKAADFQRADQQEDEPARKFIDPKIFVEFYKNDIIPLTKEIEIDYFMTKL